MKARTIVAGFMGGALSSGAVVLTENGIWWPLGVLLLAIVVGIWAALRNDREIRRMLAERRRQRNEGDA